MTQPPGGRCTHFAAGPGASRPPRSIAFHGRGPQLSDNYTISCIDKFGKWMPPGCAGKGGSGCQPGGSRGVKTLKLLSRRMVECQASPWYVKTTGYVPSSWPSLILVRW